MINSEAARRLDDGITLSGRSHLVVPWRHDWGVVDGTEYTLCASFPSSRLANKSLRGSDEMRTSTPTFISPFAECSSTSCKGERERGKSGSLTFKMSPC